MSDFSHKNTSQYREYRKTLHPLYVKSLLRKANMPITEENIKSKISQLEIKRENKLFNAHAIDSGVKKCLRCGEIKKISLFHKIKANKDGRREECSDCYREKQKRWYKNKLKRPKRPAFLRLKALPISRTCKKCGVEKSIGEFYIYNHKGTRKVAHYECKVCARMDRKIYSQKYRENNPEKFRTALKNYRTRNKNRLQERARLKEKKEREILSDTYIKQLLCHRTVLSAEDIPQELVELKRLEIQLKREVKNVREKTYRNIG